ncbi:MAG: anhydro-N-acetylmuramic acid kinase [Candidatus Hydrogenedentes bacterium]|nr:anhydro-N-acetylmuramic acid kinase [Candidatus Hydrogenedentota bacterium]
MSLHLLDDLRERPVRFIVGMMSGTSCDGVDAALVRLKRNGSKTRVKLIAFKTLPYSAPLKARLLTDKKDAKEVCSLSFELGQIFAQAAESMQEEAKQHECSVDLIASHGHTIAHCPPRKDQTGCGTLQIAEPAIIADRTGVPVISDFRVRDMAAGGQGAPLVPYADWVLFRQRDETVGCLNIGGIANITVVTPKLRDVFAFDTGPGNMPIDGAMRLLTRGQQHLDWDGASAAKGKVLDGLLERLLDHDYFDKLPPKSTGREEFGEGVYLPQEILSRAQYAPEDVMATVTFAVARSIALAHQRFIAPLHTLTQIIVSGGGARNRVLMKCLRQEFAPIEVRTSDKMGLPGDAREAIAFAILGNESLCLSPSNVPGATGALHPAILGKVTF